MCKYHATKVISGTWELSYPARLAKLKLPTLAYRRNRGDAILTYELMTANILPALFPTVGPNSRTRGHYLKLVKQPTLSRVHTQFFSSRIVNSWNKLSEETVTAESVDIFKRRLDTQWSTRERKLNWKATDQHSASGH